MAKATRWEIQALGLRDRRLAAGVQLSQQVHSPRAVWSAISNALLCKRSTVAA